MMRYIDALLSKERPIFTDQSAEEFMCKLNAIQNEMINMKHVPTEKDGIVTNRKSASVKNPEQQRHLFEGDIVLTDEQMEVILECYSNIGRISRRAQNISIGNGCSSLGTVAHEIGHALGYFHEQSRYDRDAYVRIIAENVQNGLLSRFTKQPQITMVTYGVAYDFGSVMHYQRDAFSSNGKDTVVTLDANYQSTIGQRTGLSFADIKKMNFAYCNETCPQKLQCLNNGYTDPKNCSQCRCPDGSGGELCNELIQPPNLCEPLEQNATTSFRVLSAFGAGNCNFRITAPANRRVTIQLDILLFRRRIPCTTSFVEVRYGNDLSTTGARSLNCSLEYTAGCKKSKYRFDDAIYNNKWKYRFDDAIYNNKWKYRFDDAIHNN
ncbi:unnamed protein product [Toxocara canis]|uniref:Metalloendopeptidase n=1 Tax=Toxocara canis TaxID=6265 RepID=A0A183V8P1_TOXCA|nr:unnamed protein product [Toxocara canis]